MSKRGRADAGIATGGRNRHRGAGGVHRLLRRAAAALAMLLAVAAVPAFAQDYCDDLRARLNERGFRGGGQEDALMRQLAGARRAASYQGCGGFGSRMFGNRGACARISADIARIERQLYGRDRDYGPSPRESAFIRRQMDEAGCFDARRGREEARSSGNWGPYRTLCVRSCDGYYFPISASADRGDFDTHARACQAACPGQEVTLFTQPVGDDDPRTATSPDGRTYAALATAFSYRREFNPACGCNPADGWAAFVARARAATTSQETLIPVPRPQPVFSEDPETLANRSGNFTWGEAEDGLLTAGTEVRLVGGPAFVYRW